MTPHDIERIAKGLTKAQRTAIRAAQFERDRGAYWPEGIYVTAEKRVRHALALKNVIRDYLRASYRLTPLGLSVRQYILEQEQKHG